MIYYFFIRFDHFVILGFFGFKSTFSIFLLNFWILILIESNNFVHFFIIYIINSIVYNIPIIQKCTFEKTQKSKLFKK